MIDLKKVFLKLGSIYTFLFVSCSPVYKSYVSEYQQTYALVQTIPDYSDLRFWAAHPWKKDPSDSVPKPLQNIPVDSSVDVFFLHPTTFTAKELQDKQWNAAIGDAEINAKTDFTSILYQASVFNKSCRVFAPRYRQAHIYSFYSTDSIASAAALELAYTDIKKAFDFYLTHYNKGRPIIIAAHSQGTFHSGRLLKEYFENKPLLSQLVCAYIIGLAIPKSYFKSLQPCTDSASTGCFVSWRTFRKGFLPNYVVKEKEPSWVINPLSWKADSISIPKEQNKGAVLYNFEKIHKQTNGATISNAVLWIDKPKFRGASLLRTKNYHAGDINLFYVSLQENIATRIKEYFLRKN